MSKINQRVIKAKAWITDEGFGYDHWQASQYSCGRGTDWAVIMLFDGERERDNFIASQVDAEAKLRMVKSRP